MNGFRKAIWALLIFSFFSCAHQPKISPDAGTTVYRAEPAAHTMAAEYAPYFAVYDHRDEFNRIGTPTAELDELGQEHVYVDSRRAGIYFMVEGFSTSKGDYTNLIYRIHFPRVPYSLIPFHLSAGNNGGLMVVITLDAGRQPVLVTTVHTCGCYLAIIPTTHLPQNMYPEGWVDQPVYVYGETLPGRLDLKSVRNPKLLIHLRPGTHRVMDIEPVPEDYADSLNRSALVQAPLIPMAQLERLPLNGGTTSFYYPDGLRKGHVKGSIKPWESILLGLFALDLFVGSDKVYADPDQSGNIFYTSLKPWNRSASDMWHFGRFLEFWGWRL